jgi:hypothetical protein
VSYAVVDRIEGRIAVVEHDQGGRPLHVAVSRLPRGARHEGAVLVWDGGRWRHAPGEEARRRRRPLPPEGKWPDRL